MGLKKKLGLGVASMALGAALVGGGTFAYFNDTEASNGNTFAAGTIDLKPELSSGSYFNITNMKPGDTFNTGSQNLKNAGTLDGDLVIRLDTNNDGGSDGSDFRTQLHVTSFKVGGTELDLTSLEGDDGILTMAELDEQEIDLGELKAGSNTSIQVKGEFHESGSPQNEYQGDSASVDFEFELKQK